MQVLGCIHPQPTEGAEVHTCTQSEVSSGTGPDVGHKMEHFIMAIL